jgi:hypothetical protein
MNGSTMDYNIKSLIVGDNSTSLETEELTITILYYSVAFLIIVISLIFINKRI